MSNVLAAIDVLNEVARRQAASTADVTHAALDHHFAKSANARSELLDELIDGMVPRLLSSRGSGPAYSLTTEGWLECELRGVVENVVGAYLRSYRVASVDQVGRLIVTGKDLAANGVGDAAAPLVWAVGRTFYLAQSGSFQKELERLSCQAPPDVEQLVHLATPADVLAYRRSHPGERVEFVDRARRAVTREVRILRDAIWATFKGHQEWPKTRQLDIEFSPRGVAVDRVAESDLFIGGTTVSLSLRGLWLTPGTATEQDQVTRVLRALCDVYVRQQDATTVRVAELTSGSDAVSENDARWVWRFLRHNMQFHVGSDAEASAFVLVPDLLAFRDASCLEDALFNLSRREKPRTARARGLVAGLPFDSANDGTDDPSSNPASASSRSAAEAPTRFNVGDLLGEGRYGEVYRASDTKLQREVALKFIRPGVAGNNALEHARALARVQHPNIVTVYEVTEAAHPTTGVRMSTVVMELVEGIALAERIGNPIDRRELKRIGDSLLDAITAYHANNLAHLDLWDHNVIVSHPLVKVLDAIYFDTAALSSTATRVGQQAKDLRSVRDIIEQMLYSGGVPTAAAATFIHDTARRDLTLVGLRAAFDVAVSQGEGDALLVSDRADVSAAQQSKRRVEALFEALTKKGGGGYEIVRLALELEIKPSEVRPLVHELVKDGRIELLTLTDDIVGYRVGDAVKRHSPSFELPRLTSFDADRERLLQLRKLEAEARIVAKLRSNARNLGANDPEIKLEILNQGRSGIRFDTCEWRIEWNERFHQHLAKEDLPISYEPPTGRISLNNDPMLVPGKTFEFTFQWRRAEALRHFKDAGLDLPGFSGEWANYHFEVRCKGELDGEELLRWTEAAT